MIACEDVRALADADVGADLHLAVVVDPDHLAKPDMITDLQEPRILDAHPWLADQPSPDLGPEGPKDRGLETGRREAEDRALE